jgi:hypothetical protein
MAVTKARAVRADPARGSIDRGDRAIGRAGAAGGAASASRRTTVHARGSGARRDAMTTGRGARRRSARRVSRRAARRPERIGSGADRRVPRRAGHVGSGRIPALARVHPVLSARVRRPDPARVHSGRVPDQRRAAGGIGRSGVAAARPAVVHPASTTSEARLVGTASPVPAALPVVPPGRVRPGAIDQPRCRPAAHHRRRPISSPRAKS